MDAVSQQVSVLPEKAKIAAECIEEIRDTLAELHGYGAQWKACELAVAETLRQCQACELELQGLVR